ncbi:Transcription factor lepE [Colletotrichum sp. SAR 10_98]|nr:Transcription factor lepE [Colletotrichum sp. SAR 10_98]
MDADVEIISSQLGGTFHIHSTRDTFLGQDQPLIANGLSFKTRLLGQSHWAIRDIFSTLGQYEGTPDTNWTGIGRCKSLARYIKARRTPAWPPPPNSKLPSKEVADALLDNYLRTTESIYRILHLPTFRRQYEALWVNDTVPDPGFLVQLKLVLAIGAVTYDDGFSLRTSAILWVYEAQVWLAEPNFKVRLNIQFLQTNLLLLFAQERVGVAGDSTWVLSGTILRKAMHMGLHRDPNHLPGRSAYETEMRRRLWNTVLEVNLQASLSSGGAPLISMSDFDTAPPANFDEEQLEADGPTPRPPNAFTQVSVAIALRQTFPQRLAVVNFLNGLHVSPGTYEDTLRIDTELREAFKGLSRILRTAFSSSSSRAQNAKSEVQLVDFHMQRYLISLHAPYFGPAHGTAYIYSQKTVVESSLRIWRAACPPPALASNGLQKPGVGETESDLPRLASCSSGFYQTATFHAALLIALDLRSQLQEEEEYSLLGPTPLRPDLMSVMEEARMWCLRVIEAGETNVKGYLLMNLVAAQIRSMVGLMKKDEVAGELIKAAKGVEEKCLPILERMAEEVGMDAAGAETIDAILGQLPEPMELWQGMEDWVFNDDTKSGDFTVNFIALEDEQEGNGSSHGDTRKTIEANPGKTVNTFGGSLADPKLGLTPFEVSCLRDTADIIIHTGSIEHCLNNYAALKAPNVSATPRLAALALPRSVSLLFVSSNRVPLLAGNTEQVPCSMAKWMPAGDGREGLTATKWVGEVFLESLNKLVTNQTEKAWAVEVHRPCIVVGDQAPNSDSMNAILRYSLQMKCAPLVTRVRGYIDFKPVDDVAVGIVESALMMAQRRTGGVSFKHHSSGVKVPVDKFREHLEQEYEGKFESVEMKDWVAKAGKAGIDPLITAYLNGILESDEEMVFPYLGA